MTVSITAELFGEEKLFGILQHMRQTAARRVMTAGSRQAARVLQKDVKNAIPSRHKDARKSVWYRSLKAKEAPDGGAKIGGSVGKGSKVRGRGKQPGRKGVGIGARNIWWIWGTGTTRGKSARYTGKKGGPVRFTGSSKAWIAPVSVYARRNKSALLGKWRTAGWKQMKKELQKGKAFNK